MSLPSEPVKNEFTPKAASVTLVSWLKLISTASLVAAIWSLPPVVVAVTPGMPARSVRSESSVVSAP